MKKLDLDELKYDYLITEDGRVYATHLKKYLSPYDNGIGYLAVKLKMKNPYGKRRQFYLHRLVAIAYLPNPLGLPDVNHKDGDKSNNHISNLEWSTEKENLKHAYKLKLLKGFIKYK